MKLKVILFPFALVVATWISIGYIWPKITQIRTLADEIEERQAILGQYQTKKNNIALLTEDINSHKDVKEFVGAYLPMVSAEEEIINWIEKSAADSGLTSLDMVYEKQSASSALPQATVRSLLNESSQPGTDGGVVATTGPAEKVQPTNDTINITVSGKYENIFKFINAMHRTKRQAEIKNFSITRQAESALEEQKMSEFLKMTLKFSFSHAQPIQLSGNYDNAIFDHNKLDYAPLQKVMTEMNLFKPLDAYSASNRENPFLP